jgi:glycine/D-amino acid oxidase-like deaminating enzyme
MPIIGKIPDNEGAYIIGSVHSGYTSGPYMGKLLSEYILGKNVNLDSFNISRLIQKQ